MGKSKGLDVLRLIRAPRTGALILSCEKCQRKLAEAGRDKRLARLRNAITTVADATPDVRVRDVGCMKECPKDGITLCALVAGSYTLPQPVVVRSREEVAAFFAEQVGSPIPSADPVVSEAGLEPATVSLEG